MATKLNSIGVKIDPAKLREITKLDFIKDEEVWVPKQEDKSGEWSPTDKEELRKEIEEEAE